MQEHSRFVKIKDRVFTLGKRLDDAEALAASRLELAKVVDRHRKDRMHSDMKLGWKMAKEIIAQAKESGDE